MGLGQGRLLPSCPPGFHLPTPRGELRVRAQGPEPSHLWPRCCGTRLAAGQTCPLEGLASSWPGEVMVVVSCPLLQLNLPSWPS